MYVVIFAIFMSSCKNADFKELESGLQYKFYVVNEDAKMPKEGDLLVLSMQYFTDYDSLLFDTKEIPGKFRMQMKNLSAVKGTIDEAFSLMHEGDSGTFLIDANTFFTHSKKTQVPLFVKHESKLRFEIKLVKIESFAEFEKQRLEQRSDEAKEEEQILKDYLSRANISVEPSLSGLYFIEQVKGNGKMPKAGNALHVHYIGSFIDGKPFDISYDRGQPLKFILGVGQVIEGWDEGISKMSEGGRATLIIPSNLAYKDKGHRDLIPPYTTLIFEIELLKVDN
ncbi:MAG: hypothetical protein A2W98_09805 [Bacteroidetes bacterium GWF2_33_38]|nr:MAG: hypothetical protein A2W98_09805 [Bacteroidetes bacterium GWF2_33_38]OFY72317.1 MAG: hypothetical protein A2265_00545 [Bacteroidetes bacterium RIFOXYA12_FULL_33_9]OFY90360.1 MAG: hypothetical protein A2236_06585 [Bacteroidetes bacterium RIFOXYA2_FULL_33_7]